MIHEDSDEKCAIMARLNKLQQEIQIMQESIKSRRNNTSEKDKVGNRFSSSNDENCLNGSVASENDTHGDKI